jgi:hypothetical protein
MIPVGTRGTCVGEVSWRLHERWGGTLHTENWVTPAVSEGCFCELSRTRSPWMNNQLTSLQAPPEFA